MKKIRYYLNSLRLRTLPLSLSGIVVGTGLAAADYNIDALTVALIALTTVLLQVLSNVSNEYGDFKSGTDLSEERVGPTYSQSVLTPADYRRMIVVVAVLCCVSGVLMVWRSFSTLFCLESVLLLILGASAIMAAVRYTLGSNPYGYRGWGDVYVFLFFGVVSVLGSYFVAAHQLKSWLLMLPAASIGFFSVAVLNVNNIRDMASDASTRSTVPLKIGARNAKIYHTLLIAAGWAAMLIYSSLRWFDILHFVYVLTLPLFVIHLVGVWRHEGAALDKYLPMLVISTFIFSLLVAFGFTAFLYI